MKTLTSTVLDILDTDPDKAARLILQAPDTPESIALRALIYHDGIGVERNLDRSFELAGQAIDPGRHPLAYLLLGFMCEHAETPDQAHGGPRQQYDHYDAERFYELCAKQESPWKEQAAMWLGDYYSDFARGGDPETGAEYYESIADTSPEAARKLAAYRDMMR